MKTRKRKHRDLKTDFLHDCVTVFCHLVLYYVMPLNGNRFILKYLGILQPKLKHSYFTSHPSCLMGTSFATCSSRTNPTEIVSNEFRESLHGGQMWTALAETILHSNGGKRIIKTTKENIKTRRKWRTYTLAAQKPLYCTSGNFVVLLWRKFDA